MLFSPLFASQPQIALAQSIIEARQPFGSPINQHFVEWFSGDALDSIWTQTDEQGINTFAMDDIIDGGFKITTGTTSSDRGHINFNAIQHYSNTGLRSYCVSKLSHTTSINSDTLMADTLSFGNHIDYGNHNSASSANWRLLSRDGAAQSTVTSSIVVDTNWHNHSVQLDSTMVKSYLDGDFLLVKTNNLPTAGLSPVLRIETNTSASRERSFSYFEVYNT